MSNERTIRAVAVKLNTTETKPVIQELERLGVACKLKQVENVLQQVEHERFEGMVSMVSALPEGSREKILSWRGSA